MKQKKNMQQLESQYPLPEFLAGSFFFFWNFEMEIRFPNSRSEANDHGITHRQCQPRGEFTLETKLFCLEAMHKRLVSLGTPIEPQLEDFRSNFLTTHSGNC